MDNTNEKLEKEILYDTYGFNEESLKNKYGRFYDEDDYILHRHDNFFQLILKNGKVRNVKLIEK